MYKHQHEILNIHKINMLKNYSWQTTVWVIFLPELYQFYSLVKLRENIINMNYAVSENIIH